MPIRCPATNWFNRYHRFVNADGYAHVASKFFCSQGNYTCWKIFGRAVYSTDYTAASNDICSVSENCVKFVVFNKRWRILVVIFFRIDTSPLPDHLMIRRFFFGKKVLQNSPLNVIIWNLHFLNFARTCCFDVWSSPSKVETLECLI